MGIFGGSFSTGLVTGFATSVDQSLQDAMAKRDEELSTAKKYMMIRQQQKQDKADEEDARIKKNLNRFIEEFGGDVAKGLAAYKAAGGSADSAEAFFADVDETRGAGLDYNLMDKFKADNIDFTQFSDLTAEKAFASVRTEIKPVDIQMQDTGLLSKIGLGRKDMGSGISAEINQMIPPVEKEAISGLSGAILDRTGTLSSIRVKNELETALGALEQRFDIVSAKIASGKDAFGKEIMPNEITKLRIQQSDLIAMMGAKEKALNPTDATSGPKLTELNSLYKTNLSTFKDLNTFQLDESGLATMQVGDDLLSGDEAKAAYNAQYKEFEEDFVRNAILDSDGDFVSGDAEYTAKALGMGDAVTKVQQSIIEQNQTQQQPSTPSPSASQVRSNPQAYVNNVLQVNPTVSVATLRQALIAANVPVSEIDNILGR